jgi:hypothetical protein
MHFNRLSRTRDLVPLIRLWSLASTNDRGVLYRKGDWNELDRLLFKPQRTMEDTRRLVEIMIRQWALDRELKPYDEEAWRAANADPEPVRKGSLNSRSVRRQIVIRAAGRIVCTRA